MKINIKRIDKSLEIPEYKTKGSVGFDLSAREETQIKPLEVKLVPTNLVFKTPKGYGLFLFSRSSLALKKGLMLANGVGVVDWDYSGEEDEVKVSLLNFSKKRVKIEKGERIAQGVFIKTQKVNFKEVKKMAKKSRGGFGSTGHK